MSIVDSSQTSGASFVQTLQMLANPEEVQRRFQALVEQQAKTEELLKLVGPANQILDMRRSIEEDLNTAKVALGEARMQASMLVDTARLKAQDIENEVADLKAAAEKEAAEGRQEVAALRNDVARQLSEARRLNEQCDAKLIELESAKAAVEREREELRGARVAFENRLQATTDIVEQFRSALGAL